MTIEQKAQKVVEKARQLAAQATSWAEFSNQLFAEDGVVATAFPLMTERKAFFAMPQNAELDRMLLELIKRFGVAQAASSKKSGKFLVRLPKSLHASLEVEAQEEGVSLNQLATTKLALPLQVQDGQHRMSAIKSLIVEAYKAVYDGYASDRILVHPELNPRFLAECRRLGVEQSDWELNRFLLNTRKSGKSVLPPATKKPKINDYDEFLFASEIAFRHLQRQDGVSLDRVLCDPSFRQRFDEIATRLRPDVPPFKFRMGALYLRKMHRLSPEEQLHAVYDLRPAGKIKDVRLADLPDMPGLYVFFDRQRPIFANDTAKLRYRIELHLKTSNRLFLPQWLELGCEGDLELRFFARPKIGTMERLNWLNHFINAERPLLNYQKENEKAAA